MQKICKILKSVNVKEKKTAKCFAWAYYSRLMWKLNRLHEHFVIILLHLQIK